MCKCANVQVRKFNLQMRKCADVQMKDAFYFY